MGWADRPGVRDQSHRQQLSRNKPCTRARICGNTLVCPGCVSETRMLAVTTEAAEVKKIPHHEFLGFYGLIERNVPEELEIHRVVDNYSS